MTSGSDAKAFSALSPRSQRNVLLRRRPLLQTQAEQLEAAYKASEYDGTDWRKAAEMSNALAAVQRSLAALDAQLRRGSRGAGASVSAAATASAASSAANSASGGGSATNDSDDAAPADVARAFGELVDPHSLRCVCVRVCACAPVRVDTCCNAVCIVLTLFTCAVRRISLVSWRAPSCATAKRALAMAMQLAVAAIAVSVAVVVSVVALRAWAVLVAAAAVAAARSML